MFKLLKKGFVVLSIEAPFTLLQEPVKVIGFNAIELAQMTLGLVPEVLNAVDMIVSICKEL